MSVASPCSVPTLGGGDTGQEAMSTSRSSSSTFPSLFEMSRLQERIEEEIGICVDLVTPGGLRRRTLARARDDAVAV